MTAEKSVTAQGGHGDDQCMGLVSLALVYFSMCLYVVCVHITLLYQNIVT